MNKPPINEDLVRRVICSLGFPEDRVESAVSCLMGADGTDVHAVVPDHILSLKDTCRTLSLSKSSLRRLMNAGEIRAIHLSKRRIGFRARDVNAFVESRCHQPVSPPFPMNKDT